VSCTRRLGYREDVFFFVDCDGEPLYFFRLGQLLELLRVRGCRKGWRCDRPGEYVVEVEGVGEERAESLYEARDLLLLMLRRLAPVSASSPQISAAQAPRSASPAPRRGA
jgi:hypothetical protein